MAAVLESASAAPELGPREPAACPGTAAAGRLRVRIRGLVQGVGFRPHVFRQARRFGLGGFVRNDPDGVLIECEGQGLDGFLAALRDDAPPLSRIDALTTSPLGATGERAFRIARSGEGVPGSAAIPADVGLCEDCLRELFDPADRRYLHPFIACVSCGPRFTMTRRLPYDRDATAMADFDLCGACAVEYGDPENRRFHAEPVACHDCGPALDQSIAALAGTLRAGGIVALKGIGGFHLACDARDPGAVARLRERKQRDGKPFAVMVLNTASARRHAQVDGTAEQLLVARERPVLVLPAHPRGGRGADRVLAEGVSPGLDTVGLLLPYTAIHYLLLHELLGRPAGGAPGTGWLAEANDVALVMTSANASGDPLVVDGASPALRAIADRIADHDREIAVRADDSVVRIVDGAPLFLRRARGYTPGALRLPDSGPRVLALGAHLKSTVTFAVGHEAHLSQHVGDLDSPETVAFHAETARRLQQLLRCKPERLACDLHPDYASSRLAERLAEAYDLPLTRVQHHHAHIAAVLAEHGHQGPALGVALDGHGLGREGEAWGGELLRVDGGHFERLGHFAPLAIPGGDRAASEPWRMAAAALHRLGRSSEIPARFPGEPLAPALAALLAGGTVATSSSAGRFFDAAAGLLGIARRSAFEGDAPMRLEALATSTQSLASGYTLIEGELAFDALLSVLADEPDANRGAALLHGTLLDALHAWVCEAAARTGLGTVALGGGCFLNHHLAAALPARLRAAGLEVLTAQAVPPNDGAISLGQAWVARHVAPEN